MPFASSILVINSGSSSLKFSVLDPETEAVFASGIAERLNTEGTVLKLVDPSGASHQEAIPRTDHRNALLRVIEFLGIGQNMQIKAIGHRVVHGGEDFCRPVLVTESVLQRIEEHADLAPLHNPACAQGDQHRPDASGS